MEHIIFILNQEAMNNAVIGAHLNLKFKKFMTFITFNNLHLLESYMKNNCLKLDLMSAFMFQCF